MDKLGYWDMTFDYLALDENDGDKIMGVVADEDGVATYKGYSIWYITGTDPEYDMRATKISSDKGVVSNNVLVRYNGADYFLSPDGYVYRRSGRSVDKISQKIYDSFKDLSVATLAGATAGEYQGEYWLHINDTMFICDMNIEGFPWRKSDVSANYFAYYDTTISSHYAKKRELHFAKTSTDSIFCYDLNDTCTTDIGNTIAVLYKSPPFLKDGEYKISGGTIEAVIPYNDSILIRLLSDADDTLAKVKIHNDSTYIDNMYDFSFDCVVGSRFSLVILDNGVCDSLTIKRYWLDYEEYSK